MICWIIHIKVHCEEESSGTSGTFCSRTDTSLSNRLRTIKMFHLIQKKALEGDKKVCKVPYQQTSYFFSSLYIHRSTILKKTDLFSWVHTRILIQQILQRATSFCCRLFFTVVLHNNNPILQSSWSRLLKTTGVTLTKTDTQKGWNSTQL